MSIVKFEKLFTPLRIADLQLGNRIVMPAMTTNYGNADGSVSRRLVEYYKARAEGGAGLIVVEPACVDYPRGKGLLNELDISSDEAIPGLEKLAMEIKASGCAAAIQLHHAGWQRFLCEPIVAPPVSPSPLKYRGYDTPDELTVDQIQEIVAQFADAAVRARTAGFDAVELHGAHGYLIAQFLSSRTNHRTDDYGGELAGRARLLLEIAAAIRRRTNPGFPILCRIDGDEFDDVGITVQDSSDLARMLELAGVNAVHVSVNSTPGRSSREIVSNVPPMGAAEGTWVHIAARVKQACTIPVIAVGNIRRPEFADRLLQSGEADLVAIGRQHIADPRWPAKIRDDQEPPVRPCIACNACIRSVTAQKSTLVCAVNAGAGREGQFMPPSKGGSKRVLVLGGGPAGMQAAIEAARRGHHVDIWEAKDDLGGQLHLAAVPPEKENLLKLLGYLKGQVRDLGVATHCDLPWTLDHVSETAPDVVVVAVGSREELPPMLRSHQGAKVVSARQVLSGGAALGDNILIVGGGAVGCEVADFLSSPGRRICIVEQKPIFAPDMDPMRRRQLLLRLKASGAALRNNTRLLTITPEGGEIASLEGTREMIAADTIVHACEPAPRKLEMDQLNALVPEIYTIGDALRARGILEAVTEGWMVGRRI